MSTIAYDHKKKIIAYDSWATLDGVVVARDFEKHYKTKAGDWFIAGNYCDAEEFMTTCEHHNNKANDTKNTPNCHAFLAMASGEVFLVIINHEGYCKHDLITENFTIGSGDSFALAGLDLGLTAKGAVEYAISRDVYSGGCVREFQVKRHPHKIQ